MNIIIVAKPGALPKTINLTHTRTRVMCGLILGAASLGCGLLGVGLALAFASPRDRALAEVHALREQLGQQKQDLLRIRGDAQRDADALAVKLGELQAQATRLNALGERLTRVGKLADGEFNFNEAPAVGGPEEPAALTAPPVFQYARVERPGDEPAPERALPMDTLRELATAARIPKPIRAAAVRWLRDGECGLAHLGPLRVGQVELPRDADVAAHRPDLDFVLRRGLRQIEQWRRGVGRQNRCCRQPGKSCSGRNRGLSSNPTRPAATGRARPG